VAEPARKQNYDSNNEGNSGAGSKGGLGPGNTSGEFKIRRTRKLKLKSIEGGGEKTPNKKGHLSEAPMGGGDQQKNTPIDKEDKPATRPNSSQQAPDNTGAGTSAPVNPVNTGYDSDDELNDKKGKKGEDKDIAKDEKDIDTSSGNKSAISDKEFSLKNDIPMTDALNKGYTGNKNKTQKKNVKSKVKKRIILAVISVIFTTVGILATLSPSFLINHLRDVLTGKIGQLQSHHSKVYRRKKIHKVADLLTKEGRLGGRVIAEMENSGYRFYFDPDNPNAIKGIKPPGANYSILNNDTAAVGELMDDYMDARHPLMSKSKRWKTNRFNALTNRYNVSFRAVTQASANDIEGKPKNTLNRNIAQDIYKGEDGVPDLRGNAVDLEEGETGSKIDDVDNSVVKSGGAETFEDIRTNLVTEGTELDDLSRKFGSEIIVISNQIERGASGELFSAIKKAIAKKSLGGRVFTSIKAILNPLDVPARVCSLKNKLKASVTIARSKAAQAMLKLATAYISGADATRMGITSSALLGGLLSNTTSADSDGLPIGASSAFSWAQNGKYSSSQNSFLKGSHQTDGKTTGMMNVFQKKTNNFPGLGSKSCGVIQNPISGLVTGIALWTFTSGGISVAINTAKVKIVEAFAASALKAVLGFVGKIAGQAAIELSFEGIFTLAQLYSEKKMYLPVTGQEKGADLGGKVVAGAGVLHKQRNLLAGQVPLTASQYETAYADFEDYKKEEMKNTSMFARIFDYNNFDSLAFSVVGNVAFSVPTLTGAANSFSTTVLSAPRSIFSTIGKLFSPRAYAAVEDEVTHDVYITEGDNPGKELAADPSGNLITGMPEWMYEDAPTEQWMVDNSFIDSVTKEPIGVFEEHVENCVYSIDTISMIEYGDPTNPAQDCMATQETTKNFRRYLAHLDLEDSVKSEYLHEDLESGNTNSTNTGPSVQPQVLFDVNQLGNHTDTVQCAAGTNDLGVVTTKYTGSLRKTSDSLRIRLCQIPDLPGRGNGIDGVVRSGGAVVNADVSAAWHALALKAKADGISLYSTSSFRLADSCGGTGTGSLCARPGKSIHQGGWAIDFANMSLKGTSTTSCSGRARLPGSPQWSWMEQNAESFGFRQYTKEAWHWDPLPSANRCGTGE